MTTMKKLSSKFLGITFGILSVFLCLFLTGCGDNDMAGNITDAVKVRAMDFELPDEWMAEPDLFLFKPYDDKMAMIKGLMTPITVEMVIQEINRYADSEFRYADKSDEVAIEGMVREYQRQEEAKRRYLEGKG